MLYSSLEKNAVKKYQFIAGIDEVGRGPLAGPVAAGIVALKNDNFSKIIRCFPSVKDSKLLSRKQREEIFERVKDNSDIEWKVSFVNPKIIDRINIWQATLLAWKRCLKKISQPDFLFLDGRMIIPRLKIEQKAIIKGDQKIFLLALASIVAKVNRDRLMEKLDKKYPEYGFIYHKGYGTELHLERLKKYGPCSIHRRSFKPVFDNLSFSDKVYYTTSQIAKGQAMTYKQVAELIGCPKAYRAVGNVLNKNNDSGIPCYRVIRSDGKIGGYNKGNRLKEELLRKEKDRLG